MRDPKSIRSSLFLLGCAALAAVAAAGPGCQDHPSASGSSGSVVAPPDEDGPGDGDPFDDGAGGGPLTTPQLDTTPVVLAAKPPPPLSGGTLLVTADGTTAVAADPDRDTVWWTVLGSATGAVESVALHPADEPGRVVEDGHGLVHVALRGGGAVVTIDLSSGTVIRRTPVCAAPRGIAYDPAADTVVVACVGGELVTLAAADDSPVRSLLLDSDLRDPVVLGGGFLAVSKLRNAEVLLIDPTGVVQSRTQPIFDTGTVPTSGWRMVAGAAPGSVVLAHELATTAQVDDVAPGGYGDDVQSVVTGAVTVFSFDLTSPASPPTLASPFNQGGLYVDVTVNAAGDIAVVDYAQHQILASQFGITTGAVTSAVLDASGQVVTLFTREPPSFGVVGLVPGTVQPTDVPITAPSVADTGYDLFHDAAQSHGGLACVSCHPEGRDDGRVWSFVSAGARRTPSLVGGLLATAPFHWDGNLADVGAVMSEVFTKRMGGDIEDSAHSAAVARFLDAIPRVPLAVAIPGAGVTHGQQLFESAEVGCTGCHSGPHLTNNATVDVGTGQAFQVPTLVGVGLRAPYLHDGCAGALVDRFGACGGGDSHGHTSQLSSSDVSDLVSYLETL